MKQVLALLATLSVSLLIVGAASAAKPTATLSLASVQSNSATFSVTVSGNTRGASVWVANKCYLDGELVGADFQPVVSGAATVSTGPFQQWQGDVLVNVYPDSCTAYVWLFPSNETPISVAVSYTPVF